MFTKLKLFFSLFQKGKAVANPDVWKSRAKLGNALVAVIAVGISLLAAFGVELPVGGESIEYIAYGLASLWIGGFGVYRTVTSESKGLPNKSQHNK